MKVESMLVQAPKSTTRHRSPAAIRSSPKAFMAGLFKNEPFPSQRIQLNPSKIPTKIGHSVVTEKRPSFERRKAEDYKIRAATGQSSIRKFTPSLPQIGLAGGDHSFSPLQRGLPRQDFPAFEVVITDHRELRGAFRFGGREGSLHSFHTAGGG